MLFLVIIAITCAQQYDEERTTYEPEPHPYSFSFVAGRYPGHVDRTRAEYGDGSGNVKGRMFVIFFVGLFLFVGYIFTKIVRTIDFFLPKMK